jgi:hypothetical protein
LREECFSLCFFDFFFPLSHFWFFGPQFIGQIGALD